ncbi:hypothetical protein ACJIZ3_006157 [Penstemon smallii]|uniref:Uncharacterized protein n=1 Tax=Penstemon smallii TaxID=265156 RepID=A0ABD3S790_9LAMI
MKFVVVYCITKEMPASEQKSVKCSIRKKKSLRSRSIFFFLMFLSTCYTKKLNEVRNAWHSGWWAMKLVMLLISFVIPFFIPTDYVQIYGELARVGAGVFLILQLISVVEFITWWNNYWMSDDPKKSSCSFGLFMSTIFFIASVGGIVVMYVLYASKTSCTLNIFFITWTAILLIVMMVISLHSKVNRGLLSSGIMASYIVFLCWTAIRSEPASEKCSPQKQETGHGGWGTIVFIVSWCYNILFFLVVTSSSLGNIYFPNYMRGWIVDPPYASLWDILKSQ